MNSTPFQAFLELVKIDQEIEGFNKQVAKINDEVAAERMQENQHQAALGAAEQAVREAQKEVDAKELDMRTLDAQEKEKKHRLENVTGHKEYQSIKTELESVAQKQQALEATLLHVWHTLETKKKELEAKKSAMETNITTVHASIKTKEEEENKLQQEIAQRTAVRDAKEKEVPQEWLEKYVLMRARVPDPVVPVLHGSCSACFYKVTEQDMTQLRRRKLLQCKDCYRFLYLESPEATEHP